MNCFLTGTLSFVVSMVFIYCFLIKPKIDRHIQQEGYRNQYYWKRPFWRHQPRKPFYQYSQDYYPQEYIYDIKPNNNSLLKCATVPELNEGTARIPEPDLKQQWSIEFDFQYFKGTKHDLDDLLLFRKGIRDPSPALFFSPAQNAFIAKLKRRYNAGYEVIYIPLPDNINVQVFNSIRLEQNFDNFKFYINNRLIKEHINQQSIHNNKGSLFFEAHNYSKFRNIKVCKGRGT